MMLSRTATEPYGIGALPPDALRVGMLVWYYSVLPTTDPDFRTQEVIRSEPWQLGSGHWVVKLEGRSGGFSVTHLCPR